MDCSADFVRAFIGITVFLVYFRRMWIVGVFIIFVAAVYSLGSNLRDNTDINMKLLLGAVCVIASMFNKYARRLCMLVAAVFYAIIWIKCFDAIMRNSADCAVKNGKYTELAFILQFGSSILGEIVNQEIPLD